jgi:hypothetical protein
MMPEPVASIEAPGAVELAPARAMKLASTGTLEVTAARALDVAPDAAWPTIGIDRDWSGGETEQDAERDADPLHGDAPSKGSISGAKALGKRHTDKQGVMPECQPVITRDRGRNSRPLQIALFHGT